MSRILLLLATILIVASLILQILSMLGNFNGLRSVYIARLNLASPANSGGFFDDLFNKATDSLVNLPDYFTLALFVACEGKSSGSPTCTPPTFGYKYNTTGILQTVQNQIPSWVHRALTGIQGGVFIPSVIFCFLLLCYTLYKLCAGDRSKHGGVGCCVKVMVFLLSIIAFLFCLATFVIQIVVYNMIKHGVNELKDSLFGGLIDDVVELSTKTGPAIWMSLAAFICLFFVTILLCVNICCGGRPKRTREESYEMGHV